MCTTEEKIFLLILQKYSMFNKSIKCKLHVLLMVFVFCVVFNCLLWSTLCMVSVSLEIQESTYVFALNSYNGGPTHLIHNRSDKRATSNVFRASLWIILMTLKSLSHSAVETTKVFTACKRGLRLSGITAFLSMYSQKPLIPFH